MSVYLTKELCKFFLTGNCHRGDSCNYSHQTKEYPCKYLHGTGVCEKAHGCIFKHSLLNEQEIQKFMSENEDFLKKVLKETGTTNLSDYFLNYLKTKDQRERQEAVPKDVMIPPNLLKLEEEKQAGQTGTAGTSTPSGQATSSQQQPGAPAGSVQASASASLPPNLKELLGSIASQLQGQQQAKASGQV